MSSASITPSYAATANSTSRRLTLSASCARSTNACIYRVNLESLTEANLDAPKTPDGLMALKWFKEGTMDLIEEYYQKDVELRSDLIYLWTEGKFPDLRAQTRGAMRIALD